jgi:hypothetical protein
VRLAVNNLGIFVDASSSVPVAARAAVAQLSESSSDVAGTDAFVLRGTGMYQLFSKMNHACIANTIHAGGGMSSQITVLAKVDIKVRE